MLVDVTEVLNEGRLSDPLALADLLRRKVREKTGCNASVGMGPNPLLARMATRRAKPDGMFLLRQEDAEAFMRDVPVKDLPGVGRVTANKLLQESRVETCGQLQDISLGRLQRDFGPKTGRTLHSFCRGIDGRDLNLAQERKSIGAEVNYGIRFKTSGDCAQFLDQLSAEVGARMEKAGLRGRCVTLKLMVRAENAPRETSKFLGHGICDAASRSGNLSSATRDAAVIGREVRLLHAQMGKSFDDLRGVGIQVTKLEKDAGGSAGDGAGRTKSMLNFVRKLDKAPPPQPSENKRPPLRHPPQQQQQECPSTSISFSQVDPEVLAELPEDIRKEIQQSCSLKATPSSSSSRPKIPPADNLEVTFSQLDPDVLAALPEELRTEVEQEYSRRPKRVPTPATATAFDKIMNSKQQEGGGAGGADSRNATPTKKKRGRPRKNSPRFIKRSNKNDKGGNNKEAAKTLFSDQIATPTRSNSGRPHGNSPRNLTETRGASKELFAESSKVCDDDKAGEASEEKETPPRPRADLNGVREVADVRNLLRAWMESASEPTRDDVETVETFLCDLVDEDDLEAVLWLIRFLHRKGASASSASEEWRAACGKIIDSAQSRVVAKKGARLYTGF